MKNCSIFKMKKMLRNLFSRKSSGVVTVFNGHYIDVKAMYVMRFAKIPCVCFAGELDVSRAYAHVEAVLRDEIVAIYEHAHLNYDRCELLFNNTVIVLRKKRMIEFADNYCLVLHTIYQYEWAHKLIMQLGTSFRSPPVEVETRTRVIGFRRDSDMN
jgi:hypothetical protein